MDADIIFLGGGPAGYVGAIHAAHNGMKTLVIEQFRPGGVCLFTGCIPSKALLSAAHEFARLKELPEFGIHFGEGSLNYKTLLQHTRKVIEQNARGIEGYLFPRAGVELLRGRGRLISPQELEVTKGSQSVRVRAPHIVLATGSKERWLQGFRPQPPVVVSSQEIFYLDELPERVGIVGGGVIGCEFSDLFVSLGRTVTLFELTDSLLPGFDPDLQKGLLRSLRRKGVKILLNTQVSPPEVRGKEVKLCAGSNVYTFDLVLLAVGRIPNSYGIGALELGVTITPEGFIPSSSFTYKTNVDGIYSVGDLRSPPMLAHKASLEAVRCVEGILGHPVSNEPPIPSVVYTDPEIATVGLSESAARAKNIPLCVGIFPLSASGRARASGDLEGFIKVVGNSVSRALLGVHLFCKGASEMIHSGVLALAQELTAEELFALPFPHPTLSEGLYEAILLAFSGKAHHL